MILIMHLSIMQMEIHCFLMRILTDPTFVLFMISSSLNNSSQTTSTHTISPSILLHSKFMSIPFERDWKYADFRIAELIEKLLFRWNHDKKKCFQKLLFDYVYQCDYARKYLPYLLSDDSWDKIVFFRKFDLIRRIVFRVCSLIVFWLNLFCYIHLLDYLSLS